MVLADVMTRQRRNGSRRASASTLRRSAVLGVALALWAPGLRAAETAASPSSYVLNDSHFHLTNYVQEGTDIRRRVRAWEAAHAR
jgi:hypothetical protein